MGRIKKFIQEIKGGEDKRPSGIPAPPDDSGWRMRRGDLNRFDLSSRARENILRRRQQKEAIDNESMKQFLKSFGIDEEDF